MSLLQSVLNLSQSSEWQEENQLLMLDCLRVIEWAEQQALVPDDVPDDVKEVQDIFKIYT